MPLTNAQLAPIMQATRQAIDLTQRVQANYLTRLDKEDDPAQTSPEPVTIADYGAQIILGRAFEAHFPQDGILSEESGDQFLALVDTAQQTLIFDLLAEVLGERITQAQAVSWLNQGKGAMTSRMWTIDPIDGTKGFLGRRHYAIGIGILEEGMPVGALMGCPYYGEAVTDERSRGALFVVHPDLYEGVPQAFSLTDGHQRSLRVSARGAEAYRIVQSVEKAHASKGRIARVRERAGLGDARLYEMDSMEKCALVASGDADLYLRIPRTDSAWDNRVWDYAPGVALVQSAGGIVTDLDGNALDFSQGEHLPNQGMVVSNGVGGGALHGSILQAIADVLGEDDA